MKINKKLRNIKSKTICTKFEGKKIKTNYKTENLRT